MQAMVQDRYGPPEVLRIEDIDVPAIGPDEVLVEVRAAAIDPGELALTTGVPYVIRLMGFGFRKPKVPVRGTDFAGLVEAIGASVTEFQPGDEVFGDCFRTGYGSLAEYTCARADTLVGKPEGLTFEQAAAVPSSGPTALRALRDLGEVTPGKTVLVIGAAGGVGTFAVQIAKTLGAEVTGLCSTAKMDLVRSIGADHLIDYTKEEFADGVRRYDVILDTAGNRSLRHLRRGLAPDGTLVIIGGRGGRWVGGTDRNLRAMMLSPFIKQTLHAPFFKGSKEALQSVKELIEAGEVIPVIDRTYPLQEVPAAIRYIEAGRARGKVLITM